MTRPLSDLPEDIARAGMSALRALVVRVRTRMSEEGQPVKYPIDWDTPRQQKYVMWRLAREGNLPYRRTGAYRLGWHAEGIPFGVSLRNAHPAGAIGGTPFGWQSRVTRGRWNFLIKVLFEELAAFPRDISHYLSVMGKEST